MCTFGAPSKATAVPIPETLANFGPSHSGAWISYERPRNSASWKAGPINAIAIDASTSLVRRSGGEAVKISFIAGLSRPP